MNPTAKVIEHLTDVVGAQYVSVKANGSYEARCPAHDDHNPSLTVTTGDDGRVLLHCHAGCTTNQIVNVIGLNMADLFPENSTTTMNPSPKLKQTKPKAKQAPLGPIVASYDYHNAEGVLIYQSTRHEPKTFRLRRPDGQGGWVWKMAEVQRILYRLPQLIAAPSDCFVFIPEGEKDTDRLTSLGRIATTAPQGAGKWNAVDDTPLHGRPVVIIEDNDQPGRHHAADIANRLHGKASSVRVLKLSNLPDKGDVSDWLDANKDDVEELTRLAEACKQWEPMKKDAPQPARRSRPKITNLADVEPTEVQWLWPSRFALGKVSMIAGHPGLGKTFITIDMAARVSRGIGWPDAPSFNNKPGGVVMINCEDALGDTIRPRLDAAEAVVNRINAIESILRYDPKAKEEIEYGFCLEQDIESLRAAIKATPDCRLVVIDPITAYLGGSDSYKTSDVRGLLAPLSRLAEDFNVAVVMVNHLNKNSQGDAVNRVSGSGAFVAAARSVWVVVKDKADDQRRLFLPIKNNIGNDQTGLAYTITEGDKGPRIKWEPDPIQMTADDAMSESRQSTGNKGALDEACEWLKGALENGPKPAGELKTQSKMDGISEATLRRAKKELNVIATKEGFAGDTAWVWKLPIYNNTPTTETMSAFGELSAFDDSESEPMIVDDTDTVFDYVDDNDEADGVKP